MQKLAILNLHVQTDSGRFNFRFVVHGRATYLCLDRTKNVYKNWNIRVSFIIYVNFDHAWVEHHPVTLMCVTIMHTDLAIVVYSCSSGSHNGCVCVVV
jgi:hypothetical protein